MARHGRKDCAIRKEVLYLEDAVDTEVVLLATTHIAAAARRIV
jgi:hypothetical protein